MSDADDLARRYLALWAEYLTALVSDPKTAELVERWIAFTNQFAPGGHDGASRFPLAWPPVAPDRPADGAAAAAGASGERDAAVGELARRLDGIEERLAALEQRRRAAAPRRRNRPPRA